MPLASVDAAVERLRDVGAVLQEQRRGRRRAVLHQRSRQIEDGRSAVGACLVEVQAACRVNGGYAIDAAADEKGRIRPAHIKDRIRAYGPTVRPDLTLKPADPEAGTWVI